MKIIREINTKYSIKNAKDVTKYLKEFQDEDREHFIVIGLNTKLQPVYREIAHIGTLNSCVVHVREIFKKAIMMSCKAIIIAHNHPSGDTNPSNEDIEITNKLLEAGKILDIDVLDHIIVGEDSYYSFDEEMLL